MSTTLQQLAAQQSGGTATQHYRCTRRACRWHGAITSWCHERRCPQCGHASLRKHRHRAKRDHGKD